MRFVVALAALALAGCDAADGGAVTDEAASEEKPALAVLTSLPIFFGEQFSLEPVASPLRSALEERYALTLLSSSSEADLADHALVFMPHPPVQTAEALVDLDEWVRAGGRLLLVADQDVKWPSDLPLGDLGRHPPFFMDTGLLAHWGVRLEPPVAAASEVPNRGHGRFAYTDEQCSDAEGLANEVHDQLAYCRIGEGHVLILPDVDALANDAPDAPWRAQLIRQLDWLANR